jgi:hypothetical protein
VRFARSAMMSGCFSIGIGLPRSSSAPKSLSQFSADMVPVSSNLRPSRAPAASL